MAMSSRKRPIYHWKWTVATWSGFALVDALQTVVTMRAEGMHHNWLLLFCVDFSYWLPWVPATPLILMLGRRFPAAGFRSMRGWLTHLAACAAVILVFYGWAAGLQTVFNPYNESSPLPFLTLYLDKVFNGVLVGLVLYSMVLIIGYVLESREQLVAQQTETARINELLSKAQLDALRRQIEPHFLFNTLNSIAALVREQRNGDAIDMISGLSDLLRRSLDGAPHHKVELREEIEFAQKYLDIQKMRFADRLEVHMDVPKDLYVAEVPSLILQPMVENAIKHGIAQRARGGAIHISASETAGTLILRVGNDGPALPANWQSSQSGIGIANVRARLQSLYGEISTLDLHNRGSGGVEVSLSLPFVRPAENEACL
ncbi:MAG TPA: sensor histidine kinase [Acidobacteriaceae bacterium]|jgi:sensor histidine kinase YesM